MTTETWNKTCRFAQRRSPARCPVYLQSADKGGWTAFQKHSCGKKEWQIDICDISDFQHRILLGFLKRMNNSEWLTSINDADHWLPWFLLAALFPACAQQRVPVMAHAKLCWAAAYMALVKAWTACFLRVILADARGKLEFASKPPAKCGGFIPPIKNIGSCTISMGWTSLGCTSQNLVAMTSISSPQLTAAKSLISIRWIGKRRKKRPAEGLFSKITLKGPATKDRGKNLEKSAGLPNWKQSGLSASGLASGWKGSIFFGVLSLPSSKVVQVWSVLALSEKTRETQERESLWVSSIYGNDIMPKWGLLRGNASLHWTPLHSGLSFYRTLPR